MVNYHISRIFQPLPFYKEAIFLTVPASRQFLLWALVAVFYPIFILSITCLKPGWLAFHTELACQLMVGAKAATHMIFYERANLKDRQLGHEASQQDAENYFVTEHACRNALFSCYPINLPESEKKHVFF